VSEHIGHWLHAASLSAALRAADAAADKPIDSGARKLRIKQDA